VSISQGGKCTQLRHGFKPPAKSLVWHPFFSNCADSFVSELLSGLIESQQVLQRYRKVICQQPGLMQIYLTPYIYIFVPLYIYLYPYIYRRRRRSNYMGAGCWGAFGVNRGIWSLLWWCCGFFICPQLPPHFGVPTLASWDSMHSYQYWYVHHSWLFHGLPLCGTTWT